MGCETERTALAIVIEVAAIDKVRRPDLSDHGHMSDFYPRDVLEFTIVVCCT